MHEGMNREIWKQQGRMSVEEKLVPESVSYFLKKPVKYKEGEGWLAVELQNYGRYWKQLSRKIKAVGD